MCLLSEAPSPQKTDLQVRDFEKTSKIMLNFKMYGIVVLEIVQNL